MLVECSLLPIDEYCTSDDGKKKYGRYHGSDFWDVPKYGSKRWIIATYIKADLDRLTSEGYSHDEIIDGCVSFLNLPPKRRKYAKKDPQPIYGWLEKYAAKIIEKDGEKVVSALLVTDMRKSRHFWGKGKSV